MTIDICLFWFTKMDDNGVFDDTLFTILKECKTLPNFLDTIFGFLKKRTDFYCIATDPKSPVGLPEGWAEHFVKQAFFKWKPCTDNQEIVHDAEEVCPNTIADPEEVVIAVESEVANIDADESGIESRIVQKFSTSESYNGAVYDTYTWSQTITDIDIIVKLPENVASKNLSISILPQKISVALKNSSVILLEGTLCLKVKHNDAIWSLDKRKLEIHLDKSSEVWWNCLIQSEPKLNVSQIDCSRPFEELPEEAQAKIEELTWNQERKRLGLPTSDQILLQQKFKKGWDTEGCPFKGPFDPNTVIIH